VGTLETVRKSMEEQVGQLDMLQEASESQLACAKQKLVDASLSANETKQSREHAEAKFAEMQDSLDSLRIAMSNLTSKHSSLNDRLRVAERDKKDWETRLCTASDEVEAIKEQLDAQIEAQTGPLGDAFMAKQGEKERLEHLHNNLLQHHVILNSRLREAMRQRAGLEDKMFKVTDAIDASRATNKDDGQRAATAETEFMEEQRIYGELQSKCSQLLPDRDAVLQQLEDVGRARAEEEQEASVLATRWEAELRSRVAEAEAYHELRQRHREHAHARDTEQLRADSLATDLELMTQARGAHEQGAAELRQKHEQLQSEQQHAQKRAQQLAGEVQEERRLLQVDAALHCEFHASHEMLCRESAIMREQVASIAEERVTAQTMQKSMTDRKQDLKTHAELLAAEVAASKDNYGNSQVELEQALKGHEELQQRKQELQSQLDVVKPEHADLFRHYSALVEQIDILKSENRAVTQERDGLQLTLTEGREEEERAQRAKEELPLQPPPPLAVSDVLISVVFDGAAAPLELRPWDTDLEGVVEGWLTAENLAKEAQPSLVRYLRQLEENAEAFPVRKVANLVEIHEQFKCVPSIS